MNLSIEQILTEARTRPARSRDYAGVTRAGYLRTSAKIHSLKARASEDSFLPGRTSKK